MTSTRFLPILLYMVSCLTPAICFAQGQVVGRVIDSGGAAVSQYPVSIRSDNKAPFYTITDGKGQYSFFGLASGTYQVASVADSKLTVLVQVRNKAVVRAKDLVVPPRTQRSGQ